MIIIIIFISIIIENMNEWDIIDLYFKDHKYPFTNHHLDSYRELIKTYIPHTIKSYNPITMIKYDDDENVIMKIDLYVGGENSDEIFIDRPITYENFTQKLITPNEARLKNLTYETHIYANILIKITDDNDNITVKKFENVAIGSIPIMLHSDICVLNGQIPDVLRKMGECIYDTGGYFIIDGKEKVIIAQERIATNRLFINKMKDDDNFSYQAKIRCTGEIGETLLSPRTVEFYLVKPDDVTEKFQGSENTIVVSLPSIEGKIPLFILFRAFGIESDKEIYESIFGINNSQIEENAFQNFIRPSVMENKYKFNDEYKYIYTQEDALNYLKFRVKYKTIDHVKYILSSEVFHNIALFENKGKYLGYLIKQMFDVVFNITQQTDRDSYIYKRVDISGFLLAELFQESYTKLRKFIRDKLDNIYYFGSWKNKRDYENFVTKENIYKLIPVVLIADTFVKSLKGRWGMADSIDPELGRVQDLSRISYIGFLSHLRRVNMPIDRSLKVTSPHKLHLQQWGIMCPFETPDGASVGYLKNLAFLAKITAGTDSNFIKTCLQDIGIIPIEHYKAKLDRNITKVLVNSTWYGITGDPIKIMRILRAYRRNGLINILTSISWNINNNEIRILTEAGRSTRPLLIIRDNNNIPALENKYSNWFDMILGKTLDYTNNDKTEEIYYKNNYINPFKLDKFKNKNIDEILEILEKNSAVIEYLDIEEANANLIAMEYKDINGYHSHLEIHPSTILSVVTGNIPMCNHNQAARNVFHAAQTKQAIGVYSTNFNKRFDTFGFVQHYPQRPIINTRHSQYTNSDNMPNGFNTIVAIMTYSGFNQEDSIMINKKSIERGLFHLSYFKTISASSKIVSQTEKIIFANPIKLRDEGFKVNNIKDADYSLINNEGFIREGSYIPRGKKAIIIGMILQKEIYKEVKKGVFIEQIKEILYDDISIVSDDSYYGIINKVYVNDNKIGDELRQICKVRMLKIKKPEFGDKHASRHGQKGVIGMIIPEEGMPFTKDGIKPDLIINPHAIPSRMTIGHLVECVYAKLCCLEGVLGDGTVFIPMDNDKIYNGLNDKGYNSLGNEILYNGYNGTQIQTEIFIGPTFYFRLKHMVAEKINARGFGKKISLTRQPTGGKRKDGGLRIGEMERDSILSHATSAFMKESMMERSDKYRWQVCKRCGTIPQYSTKVNSVRCPLCNENESSIIETPYCFKLLVQEMEAMSIQARLNTDYVSMPVEDLVLDIDLEDDNLQDVKKKDDVKAKNDAKKKDDVKKKDDAKKKDDVKKECPEGKVYNPETGRCISAKNPKAKKLGLVGGENDNYGSSENDNYDSSEEISNADNNNYGNSEDEKINNDNYSSNENNDDNYGSSSEKISNADNDNYGNSEDEKINNDNYSSSKDEQLINNDDNSFKINKLLENEIDEDEEINSEDDDNKGGQLFENKIKEGIKIVNVPSY